MIRNRNPKLTASRWLCGHYPSFQPSDAFESWSHLLAAPIHVMLLPILLSISWSCPVAFIVGSPFRLVMDADSVPVVIRFVHTGMQEIMPVGTKFPKVGKQVTVVVGDPIYIDDLLVSKDAAQDDSRGILYDSVSSRTGHHLQELKVQAEKLALEQRFEVRQGHMDDGENGCVKFGRRWIGKHSERKMLCHHCPDGPQIVKQAPLNQPMESQSWKQFVNGRFSDGGFNIQRAQLVRAWKQFVNDRLSDEGGRIKIQEAGPFRAWKQLSDEGCFNIQEAVPFRACKQFMNVRFSEEGCFSIPFLCMPEPRISQRYPMPAHVIKVS